MIDEKLSLQLKEIFHYEDKLRAIQESHPQQASGVFNHTHHRLFYMSTQVLMKRLLYTIKSSRSLSGTKIDLGGELLPLPSPKNGQRFVDAVVSWANKIFGGETFFFWLPKGSVKSSRAN